MKAHNPGSAFIDSPEPFKTKPSTRATGNRLPPDLTTGPNKTDQYGRKEG